MNKQNFIRQTHKNLKEVLFLVALMFFLIIALSVIRNKEFHPLSFIFILGGFVCIGMAYLYDTYGVYLVGDKIYYKRVFKKEVDVSQIVAIKIIRAEARVRRYYSYFDMKGPLKNQLYTMVCVSEIEDYMNDFPYGDERFVRWFRDKVVFFSIYDQFLIDYMKSQNPNIKILWQ